jgi:uncharacterized membrane protein YqaE (UPF0057 family)
MKKSRITTIAAVLFVLSIGLTSCSKQYNLTLVKKNYRANDVAQNEKSQPLKMIDQKKINVVNESDEMDLVKAKPLNQTPVIVNQTNDRVVTSSIGNDETGIDKSLYSYDSKLKSYYPEFTDVKSNESKKSDYHNGKEDLFLFIILAILLPPVCVGLWEGGFTFDFWIDLLLTFCFWIPGVIYALIVILR